MLSREKNELLTKVGPGTPMGNLLRRYWTPALVSNELPKAGGPPLRVRLLGEDLVAFRDANGKVALVAENCPHRGTSLYFGRVEGCQIRCVYHGWAFDGDGNCVDTPTEPADSDLRQKVTLTSYPTYESGGLVWTYMGPAEQRPPFRDFGTESLPEDEQLVTKAKNACNWLQVLEGDVDTAHISYLHMFHDTDAVPDDGNNDQPGYPDQAVTWKFWKYDRAPKVEVDENWHGFRYAGLRTTPNGHTYARVAAYIFPWAVVIAHSPFGTRIVMKIPIDDENTWRIAVKTHATVDVGGLGGTIGPHAVTPYKRRATSNAVLDHELSLENDYHIDRAAQETVSFTGIEDFGSQDVMATESMGRIFDRSNEKLGVSDIAVIRLRQLLLKAIDQVAAGEDAPGTEEADYRSIRSAEKILEPNEDWRVLGTNDDPVVQRYLLGRQQEG